ncbi:hypothetical protein McpSp1_09920 [Methanocorpusculaceae archaeon Sp1]|nr:hypothetical protein [Methanocorpusculaceae archaeon Sp1]
MRQINSIADMTGGVVIKIGGSLMDVAGDVLHELAEAKTPALIIPGGGVFANDVRDLGIDGDAGHWMAVAAMDQYGWYLSDLGLKTTDICAMPKDGAEIFLPYTFLRACDPLPHSWDITSDSISAWIAGQLGCRLILLKSVDGVVVHGELLPKFPPDTDTDVIDPCCIQILKKYHTKAVILNGRRPERLGRYLSGEDVPGTRLP